MIQRIIIRLLLIGTTKELLIYSLSPLKLKFRFSN